MEAQAVHHPSADTLLAFGSGRLDDLLAAAVAAHLDNCPECCQKAAGLSGGSLLARLRAVQSGGGTPAPNKPLSGLSQSLQGVAAAIPPELREHAQYQVVRELGRGGMGVVYLVKNKLMERLEVLKVVNQELLDQPGARDRFLREIRAAAKLSHLNIVIAHAALQVGELLLFAMEYIEGSDLAKTVKAQGPLPLAHACFYVQQAAQGLQHAFEKGLVHRDIKPQNMILAREGAKHIVKILDFGLAKARREEGGSEHDLTGAGKMLGTPDYIAPEQLRDAASADIRADIYSLGCTLYFLLTGGPPFKARSLFELMQAHLSQEATPMNQVRADVPAELAAVVAKMMAKEPGERYQQPVEVALALAPFLKARVAPTVSVVPPISATERSVADAFRTTMGGQKGVSVAPREKPTGHAQPAPRASMKWFVGAGVGAALLTAVIGLWAAGVFRVRTPEGVLVIEVDEPNPDVYVDGGKVTVTWGPGGKKAEIQLKPGTRQVELKKDGFRVYGEEVTLQHGKRRVLRARLEKTLDALGKGPQANPEAGKLSQPPADGFRPLFNGKDLTGWKTHPEQPGRWRVEKGILINSGHETSYLYSERGDYTDFHLRLEARINDGGNSGVSFRSQFRPYFSRHNSPGGYEAEICATAAGSKTGSLNGPQGQSLVYYSESPVPPGKWFELEVIARGNRIVLKVDGKTTATYTDAQESFASNHISLQHDFRSVIEFRKIEIKELPPSKPAAPPAPASGDARLIPPAGRRAALMERPVWKVENDTLVWTTHADGKGWQGALVFGDPSWKDYTFSFEAKKLDDEKPFGVFARVRATDLHTHYAFAYGGYQNGEWSELARLIQGRWSRGHNPAGGNALCRKIKPMEKGRWYSFAVTVAGDAITCRVDGIKMFTWKDDSLAGGKVGLHASPGRFAFRNIRVTAPDGAVLWEGLPNLGP